MAIDHSLHRSDEVLTELTEIVETARALPMSTSCVLPRERLLDLLDELREVIPAEVDEARVVVARRERVLGDAAGAAAQTRERAVAEADALLAEARHDADVLIAGARQAADEAVADARAEHSRLVSATEVHQAAAAAARALREDAERVQQQIAAEAALYDTHVRAEADRHAAQTRAKAADYAARLTADAEGYAGRTLDELSATLHRAAQTADQGRARLAARRAAPDGMAHDGAVHDGMSGDGMAAGSRVDDDTDEVFDAEAGPTSLAG